MSFSKIVYTPRKIVFMVMMLEFFYDKGNYLRWQSYYFHSVSTRQSTDCYIIGGKRRRCQLIRWRTSYSSTFVQSGNNSLFFKRTVITLGFLWLCSFVLHFFLCSMVMLFSWITSFSHDLIAILTVSPFIKILPCIWRATMDNSA